MTRPALSTSDREEVEGSSFRRLVSPDGQHGRLRSLIGWQSPGVRRDSDRDMALSQGIQDEEEVSGGDFIVVDGKFLTGTGLMQKRNDTPGVVLEHGQRGTSRHRSADQRLFNGQQSRDNQQSEGQGLLVDEHLNAAPSVPIDHLNNSSLGYVVGSEGQVLVELPRTEGQGSLADERLNAAPSVPIDQLNTLSLGTFVGQRSKDQAPTPVRQHIDDQRQTSQPCGKAQASTTNLLNAVGRRAALQLDQVDRASTTKSSHDTSGATDGHGNTGSRGATAHPDSLQARQWSNYDDVEEDSSVNQDTVNTVAENSQRRSCVRVQQVSPPSGSGNGIRLIDDYDDICDEVCIRRRRYTDYEDGAHKTGWTPEQSTMNKFPRTSPARDTGKYDGEVELMPTSNNRGDRTLQVAHERGAIGEYSSEEVSNNTILHLAPMCGADDRRNSTILHLPPERGAVDGINTSIECKPTTLHPAPERGTISENSAYSGDGQPTTLHLARPNVGRSLVTDEGHEDTTLHLSPARGASGHQFGASGHQFEKSGKQFTDSVRSVSYTHLTLPTKRIV